MLKEGHLSSK